MAIRQITIIGTGLIGGSLALALKANRFRGRIVGCDRRPVLERAHKQGAIDSGFTNPVDAVRGSDVVVLATPVGGIIELIELLGRGLAARTLLTDVGSTKSLILARAETVFGRNAKKRFLGAHPMAGKEQGGFEFADARLFQQATWLVTPLPGQDLDDGLLGEYLRWIEAIGAKVAALDPVNHDHLCAWISHLPQMLSTALAGTLVDEFGPEAPLMAAGGRALREMTRISASPYSMWRDIALTNKKNIAGALLALEQRLAHIRENLDTRQLASEFERAHALKKK
ncbi:MAG TPA: prephenate dehydrogenase [Terriglobales bacterium]|nr:prephenate dehydrogenase [Terriglobales bacterium]